MNVLISCKIDFYFLRIGVFSLLLGFFLAGCLPGEIKQGNTYFDLKSFFQSELKNLEGKSFSFEKMSEGKMLIVPADSVNWKTELALFLELDLNKPALIGHYSKDSLQLGPDSLLVSYIADAEKFRIKKITLLWVKSQLAEIEADVTKSNFLFASTYHLVYNPLKGYSVYGSQVQKYFGKDVDFSMEARWIP